MTDVTSQPRKLVKLTRSLLYHECFYLRHFTPKKITLARLACLCLDMAPSSSEDVTRAMRGQPKWLSRNYLRQNGRNVISYVLVSFHTRDVFCTLSRLFVRPGFRLFCGRLAVHYFAVYSVLGSLIKQTSTVTATSTMAVWACVIIFCSFLSLCLQKVKKHQCRQTKWM